MTLAKAPTKWLAGVTLGLCFVPALMAQNKTIPYVAKSRTQAVKPTPVVPATKPADRPTNKPVGRPAAMVPGPRPAARPASKFATTAPPPKPATKRREKAPAREAIARAEAIPVEKPAAGGPRRDPFLPLISERKQLAGADHLPPGKAGLVITAIRVDGTVRSEEGMIAVLSNAEQRTYFVREGDRLYDGAVEKIGLDGVTFRQSSKDAFGKPVERIVTKRIYASAGEQQ